MRTFVSRLMMLTENNKLRDPLANSCVQYIVSSPWLNRVWGKQQMTLRDNLGDLMAIIFRSDNKPRIAECTLIKFSEQYWFVLNSDVGYYMGFESLIGTR